MHAYNVNQGTYDFYNSELDEFDTQTVRFKPESLDNLVKLTKFNKRELKLMYRGFKQLCPSGVVKEDKFKLIYAQFFPRGADTNGYARYVFNSFDIQRKQEITFTDFVIGLSVLTRGSVDEQLRWIFTLYDINGDGIITRDELNRIVNSIHDLMGKLALSSNTNTELTSRQANQQQQQQQQPTHSTLSTSCQQGQQGLSSSLSSTLTTTPTSTSTNNNNVNNPNTITNTNQQQVSSSTSQANHALNSEEHAQNLFKKFDLNNDGVITLDEFLEACHKDDNIIKSISVFNTIL